VVLLVGLLAVWLLIVVALAGERADRRRSTITEEQRGVWQ
jgi:hypothetical protein